MPQQEPYVHPIDRSGVSVSGAGHPVTKNTLVACSLSDPQQRDLLGSPP